MELSKLFSNIASEDPSEPGGQKPRSWNSNDIDAKLEEIANLIVNYVNTNNLDGIDLDAIKPNQIGILIGADVPQALIPVDVRHGSQDQPLAVKTKFGWTLFGGASKSSALIINKISVHRISE